MKHHDSIQQANNKLALSLETLNDWRLPATPVNYTVAYEYIVGKNTPLINAIQYLLKNNEKLDTFIAEQLYLEHIIDQQNIRDDIVEDMDDLLTNVQLHCTDSARKTHVISESISNSIAHLNSDNPEQVSVATKQLRKASIALKQQQKTFTEQILSSQQKTTALKAELDEAKKELYLDAITGLYNKKALTKHFDAWVTNKPSQTIGALVIDVDRFREFSDKFGHLIGDVILSKIAQKIGSYVDDSGLPVRTGHHEFMILLPDVEQSIASEIAEKIRQGVEKIRFVSSKSGIRLPQMTISMGVTEYKKNESLDNLMARTKQALFDAQQGGYNTISVA